MRDWKQYIRANLRALRVLPEREIEIIEELSAQLEQAYQEAIAAGNSVRDAERIAEGHMPDFRELASEIEVAQPARHRPAARFWQGVPADVRHAWRAMRKSPVFTVVAIATLAIGIGGCTTVFSLIDAVILKPIDYHDPQQLVMVWENQYRRGLHNNSVALANYLDWKARNHVFADMSPILDQVWNVSGKGAPAVLKGIGVNDRFLPLLGVQPLVGRNFTEEETRKGGPKVAILSHAFWIERFAASGDAIGQTMLFDGEPRTIVGVLPAGFPWLGKPLDVLTPTQFGNQDWRVKAGRFLRVVARVKPGMTLDQARKDMSAVALQLEAEYPAFNKDWGVGIEPLADHFEGGESTALWVLMASVGLVLLIACSNVANLMLARTVVREREMALRATLGATTQRIVRLLLVESTMLALIGGALGCGGAYAAIRFISVYGPQDVARLHTAGLNLAVAGFTLFASFLTGALFGLAPAIAAGRLNLSASLKEGGRGAMTSIRGERLRGVFVVAQVGLAFVLLTGAALLIGSLYRLNKVPVGFDPHNLLTGTVNVVGPLADNDFVPVIANSPANQDRLASIVDQTVERLRAEPGVESASFITFLPFTGLGAATDFSVVGRPPVAHGQEAGADVRIVHPAYFETMRIPLLRGRLFTAADNRADAPRTFVVNEALAKQMFGDGDPLGQSLVVRMGNDKPGRIIGVVADTKHLSLDGDVRAMVYYPQAQLPIAFGSFVMRTKGKPELMAATMEAAIREVKKDQPVSDVRTMEDRIGASIARARFQTSLLSAFALIAVVLAVIGVYGVMAYSVEQRTHEIGVRLALGAEPVQLRRMITGQGMRLAAGGLFAGLMGAAASTRVLDTLLYGVSAGDPATFFAATVLLAGACLFASYIPARRAIAVDPAIALRGE
ncbi:MAG TPA: ABC transporter permease [Bryobacteraceae bacterium]|jgi:putative ABC transport system permease protein